MERLRVGGGRIQYGDMRSERCKLYGETRSMRRKNTVWRYEEWRSRCKLYRL